MKKTVCILLTALICVSVCFADGIEVQLSTADRSISVSGGFGKNAAESNVLLTVYKSGFEIEKTAQDSGFLEDLVYTAQSRADENGGFSFESFVTGGDSGKYTVRVTEAGLGNSLSKDIYIASEADMNKFADSIKNGDREAVRQLLDNETKTPSVGLDMALYEALSDSQRDKACAEIAKNSLNVSGIESAYKLVNICCAKTGIFNYSAKEALLGYFRDDVYKLTDEEKQAVTEVLQTETFGTLSTVSKFYGMTKEEQLKTLGFMQNSSYNDAEAFYDDLNAAVIHAEIKSAKLWTEISSVLSKYDDVLTELDFNLYKNSKYKSAIDKKVIEDSTVYSVSGLCKLINDAAKNGFDTSADTPSRPSAGGGGGGGGASSPRVSGGSVEVGAGVENNAASSENKVEFSDLSAAEWAKDDILYLAKKGIINGKTKTEFCPDDIVTREEFAKMLVLALNISGEEKPMSFDDVNPSDWYYAYVKTAYSCGIITGVDSSVFGAGSPISRQDMAVMAARAIKADTGFKDTSFADNGDIAEYALSAAAYLTQNGVLSGFEDNTFRPNDNCTRAQAAKVIRRLMTL